MSLHMASGIPARVIQVLRDFLTTELALIDAEEADGITTPDIQDADFYEWERPVIPRFPALTVNVLRARPLEVQPVTFGSRIHAVYSVDVKAHVQIDAGSDDALTLQKYAFRYGAGIARVLAIQKIGLETAGDPVIHDKAVVRLREIDWGPEADQGTGQQTRTVTVGIEIDKTEAR